MALQEQPDVDAERSTESDCLRSGHRSPVDRSHAEGDHIGFAGGESSVTELDLGHTRRLGHQLPFMTMAPVGSVAADRGRSRSKPRSLSRQRS
jgi:hypothetical protein